jgi:hypothetical protein
MAIVRAPRAADNFAQISNTVLQDERLSYRARGIAASMLSRPPGWTTSSERLAQAGAEGREAVRSALKELEKFGYLVRTRSKNDKGQWVHSQEISDLPGTPEPPTGNP